MRTCSVCNMAESSDSAGPSTMTEHEATAVPSLSKLRCPQPAAISRKRKVALNPLHVASEGQQGVGTSTRNLSPYHNECESSYDCISPIIQQENYRQISGNYRGIFLRNPQKNYWKILGNYWLKPTHIHCTVHSYMKPCIGFQIGGH